MNLHVTRTLANVGCQGICRRERAEEKLTLHAAEVERAGGLGQRKGDDYTLSKNVIWPWTQTTISHRHRVDGVVVLDMGSRRYTVHVL